MNVGIVTDSTACVPAQLRSELQIEVLPVFLTVGGQVFEDGTAGAGEFYASLHASRDPATTSAPSPGVYADAILRAGQGRDAVVCITVSRQFSAMYDAAVQGVILVKQQRPDLDVHIIDSGAAAMAQGFVVLAAARAAAAGAGVDDVIRRAEALMPRVQLLVVIDTLEYLARSGRVPRLVIWAAGPLQVKPIVAFQEGQYRPLSVARTATGATDRLYRAFETRATGDGALHVCVHHTNVPDRAQALAERVREALHPAEIFVQEFTQVMGVHVGPGLLGFAFYTDPR